MYSLCKRIVYKKLLRGYRRAHTGERPFICDWCHEGFLENEALNAHKRMYLGVETFLRDQCEKTFCSTSHLKKHQSIEYTQLNSFYTLVLLQMTGTTK